MDEKIRNERPKSAENGSNMSESFYNQAPLKNARYARKMAKESHDEISEFLGEYRLAIERHERHAYESANERRKEIVSLRERVAAEIDLVPLDSQGTVAKVLTRIDETLISCQTFPLPILNNPATTGKTQAVVGNNPNKTKNDDPVLGDENAEKQGEDRPNIPKPKELDVRPKTSQNRKKEKPPISKASAPVSAPVAAPVSAPVAAPVSAPVSAPASAPVTAPVTAPAPTPALASTPASAPFSMPASASAPFQAPASTPVPFNQVRRGKAKKSTMLDFMPKEVRAELDLNEESQGLGAGLDEGNDEDLRSRRLAAFQRDSFAMKTNEYVERILQKAKYVEKKLSQGENFDEKDDDLFSVIMEGTDAYWRKNGVDEKSSVTDMGS